MADQAHKIAIIGCGYVADSYVATLKLRERIQIHWVYDHDESRLKQFCNYYELPVARSYDQILQDPEIVAIINLTSPQAHYEVSLRALQAGKHVYTEKPLAMTFEDARALVNFAGDNNLHISSAPCTLLGHTAQAVWGGIENDIVGDVFTIHAELDDGLVSKMPVDKWVSPSGAPWPYQNEFEVGCTLEHAAYYLTWAIAIFGPVKEVVSFSDCLLPNKLGNHNSSELGADLSIGVIKFHSGPVMRLTTSILSPKNHSLQIAGSSGILESAECWTMTAPVRFKAYKKLRRRLFLSPLGKKLNYNSTFGIEDPKQVKESIDFAAGIQEMLEAVSRDESPYLSADFCLHVTEVTLALINFNEDTAKFQPITTFDKLKPKYVKI